MPRKKIIETNVTYGKAGKAEVFEELIYKILGAKVKLAPAPTKEREKDRRCYRVECG